MTIISHLYSCLYSSAVCERKKALRLPSLLPLLLQSQTSLQLIEMHLYQYLERRNISDISMFEDAWKTSREEKGWRGGLGWLRETERNKKKKCRSSAVSLLYSISEREVWLTTTILIGDTIEKPDIFRKWNRNDSMTQRNSGWREEKREESQWLSWRRKLWLCLYISWKPVSWRLWRAKWLI